MTLIIAGKKATKAQIKKMAVTAGINFNEDFHALKSGQVGFLTDLAAMVKYREPKNANGSRTRYFFYYLKRA